MGRIESDHECSLLTEWTKKKSTIQVQTDEHLQHKLALNRKDGYKKAATYHRRDFGDGGNQEPNETLANEEQHISG